jgi:hypothetical protein
MQQKPSAHSSFKELASAAAHPASIARGLVIELLDSGDIIVGVTTPVERKFPCDCLEGSDAPLSNLALGDHVLVLCPEAGADRGVVLGRISRHRPAAAKNPPKAHVTIEAAESLTLNCGESSLQMRKDGKLMVLGKDVLTRARRTARIKAGSVAIN